MADQYTWEKAKQAGYKTTLQQLNRKTIADGDLLRSNVVEVFSSKDKYINDNLIAETNSANDVFNTVENNSATNWDNNLLSGFSAVKADAGKVIPIHENDTLNLNFENISTDIDTLKNEITLNFPDYIKDSYFQRTQRTSLPKLQDFPVPYGNRTLTNTDLDSPVVFGVGVNEDLEGFNDINHKMLLINGDRVQSHAVLYHDGGIIINPGSVLYNRGILINNSIDCNSQFSCGIAINDSSQGFCSQISINNSSGLGSQKPGFAMNDSVIGHNGAINFCSTGTSEMHIGLFNSIGASVSMEAYDSYASNLSFAAHNSSAQYSLSFSWYNSSSVNSLSHSLFYSTAENQSIAMYNSYSNSVGFALYNSSKIGSNVGQSIALYDSSATYGKSVALYNSLVANSGNEFAMYNSSAITNGRNAALYNSTIQCAGLAAYNSTAINGKSYALYDSKVQNNESFSMYNSIDSESTPGFLMYNSKRTRYGDSNFSVAMFNSEFRDEPYIYGGHKLAMHQPFHCHLMYNSVCAPTGSVKVYKTIGGVKEEVINHTFHVNGLVKYNSRIAGAEIIAEYNSTACMGTSGSIVMYGSCVSSTEMHCNGDYDAYNTHGIIAMYDSDATDDSDKIKLWNNAVTIEPSGYINKIRYFDTTKHSMSINFDNLVQLHQLGDYHEIIIG